jgi:hypothetical protein
LGKLDSFDVSRSEGGHLKSAAFNWGGTPRFFFFDQFSKSARLNAFND